MNTNNERPAWFLPVLAGVLVSLAVAAYLNLKHTADTPPEVLAARVVHVTPEEYQHLLLVGERVEKTHTATQEDLDEARKDFKQHDNLFLRQCAMNLFAKMGQHSPYAKEGIAMMKSYLAEGNQDGNVVAIVGLKRMGDPSWKTYAEGLRKDPNMREAANNLLSDSPKL